MNETSITRKDLLQLAENAARTFDAVIAPVKVGSQILYKRVGDVSNLESSRLQTAPTSAISFDHIVPDKSAKEFCFPSCEKIFGYSLKGGKVELTDPEPRGTQLLFGLRPCDAAAFGILKKVFSWDCKDSFFLNALERTTVLTIACVKWDTECFCTSVGLGPVNPKGSDVLLIPAGADKYAVTVVTDKGRALVEANKQLFGGPVQPDAIPGGPEVKFNVDGLPEKLARTFDDPAWDEVSRHCVGCGTCAFLCPTCHCFDIVDESSLDEGIRLKNWDACQFAQFTAHASGHNPRETQPKRYRQRIQHKFRYYPGKFGEILCTGCGRCIKYCPRDVNISEIVAAVAKM